MGRTSTFRFLALTGAVVLTAGVFTTARAQDADDLKRGVARISLINGEVSVRRGDSGDWVAGVINAPLLTDDRIGTGANSRGEVQFDSSNMLRFGANTEVRLTQLEYGRYQMVLAHGLVTYRVLRPSDANVEIDTPNVSVRPARQGSYRIAVNEAGETEVTARVGDVEIFSPTGSQWVRAGQTLMARGTASDPEFQVVAANGTDDWDRWADNRDRMLLQSTSARNVGPGVYGAEDLDAYGTWDNVPEYGNVWHPAVARDWAPYHSGRWVWEDWYGWTWVSYDPWGWAPYHYGRWFQNDRFGWCWYPGVFGARHYWSPALVGFFGFGRGAGVGFGFGNIGWVPLAPYEVFRPWWGRGFNGREGFNRSVNITNINISNTYRNARFNNGVNAVGVHEFQNGRFNNVQRFNGSQIHEAGVVRGQMPIAPSSANLRFSDRQATGVPRSNDNARFFTHQQPNPVARQSFNGGGGGTPAASAGMIQRGSGTSASGQALPPQNGNRGMQGTQQNDSSGSWRRFGSPAGQGGSPQSSSQAQAPSASGFRGNSQSAAPGNPGGIPSNQGRDQMMRNDRPAQGQSGNSAPAPRNNGGWQRFGAPGDNQSTGQRGNGMHYNAPSGGSGQNLRISPPVVRERSYSAPSYSAPRQSAPSYNAPRQSAPSYNAPRQSAPSYSAPRQSAPSYSAPRGNSGGGGGSRPSASGGGGNHGGGSGSGRR